MLEPLVQPVLPASIETLRDATRSRHARLGASPAISRPLDSKYTIQEYQSHIGRLLGLFESLECAVACAADPENPARYLERSSALREDLTIMGATASDIEGLAQCSCLPSIAPAGLYGWAYVVLGSMKSGRVIVKRLRSYSTWLSGPLRQPGTA